MAAQTSVRNEGNGEKNFVTSGAFFPSAEGVIRTCARPSPRPFTALWEHRAGTGNFSLADVPEHSF